MSLTRKMVEDSGDAAMSKKIIATYDYTDKRENLLYQKVRYRPKSFQQRRPDGNGDYIYNLDDIKPVLYRLPELLESTNGEYIFITEGEKDVDRLRDEGLCATTSGSAQSWRDEFAKPLLCHHPSAS